MAVHVVEPCGSSPGSLAPATNSRAEPLHAAAVRQTSGAVTAQMATSDTLSDGARNAADRPASEATRGSSMCTLTSGVSAAADDAVDGIVAAAVRAVAAGSSSSSSLSEHHGAHEGFGTDAAEVGQAGELPPHVDSWTEPRSGAGTMHGASSGREADGVHAMHGVGGGPGASGRGGSDAAAGGSVDAGVGAVLARLMRDVAEARASETPDGSCASEHDAESRSGVCEHNLLPGCREGECRSAGSAETLGLVASAHRVDPGLSDTATPAPLASAAGELSAAVTWLPSHRGGVDAVSGGLRAHSSENAAAAAQDELAAEEHSEPADDVADSPCGGACGGSMHDAETTAGQAEGEVDLAERAARAGCTPAAQTAAGSAAREGPWEHVAGVQSFFQGHDDDVMCIAMHPGGELAATGQVCFYSGTFTPVNSISMPQFQVAAAHEPVPRHPISHAPAHRSLQ